MLKFVLSLFCWAVRSSAAYVPHFAFDSRSGGIRFLPSSSAASASPSRGGLPIASTAPEPGLTLPLAALSAGLTAAIESAAAQEMKELAATAEKVDLKALELDEEELEGRRSRLLGELGDIESAGLVFLQDGAPSHSTLGLALVLTARRAAELDHPSVADLVAASESGVEPALVARARLALATVVSQTLAEMEAAQLFTDASSSASVSVNDAPQAQSMEEARSMHFRWAILELARARFAEDRPADWGSVR